MEAKKGEDQKLRGSWESFVNKFSGTSKNAPPAQRERPEQDNAEDLSSTAVKEAPPPEAEDVEDQPEEEQEERAPSPQVSSTSIRAVIYANEDLLPVAHTVEEQQRDIQVAQPLFWTNERRWTAVAGSICVLFLAVIIGLSVGLTRHGGVESTSSSEGLPSSELGPLEASVKIRSLQDWIIADAHRVQKEDPNGGGVFAESTGFYFEVSCEPIACLGSDTACATLEAASKSGGTVYYEPGCCLNGEECPAGTRCGKGLAAFL